MFPTCTRPAGSQKFRNNTFLGLWIQLPSLIDIREISWMDEILQTPTRLWNDYSMQITNRQSFPMASTWCGILSTHSAIQVLSNPPFSPGRKSEDSSKAGHLPGDHLPRGELVPHHLERRPLPVLGLDSATRIDAPVSTEPSCLVVQGSFPFTLCENQGSPIQTTN